MMKISIFIIYINSKNNSLLFSLSFPLCPPRPLRLNSSSPTSLRLPWFTLRDAPLRQIGSLNGEDAARKLADHLLTLGVKTQIRPAPDGWGLWALDEDRLPLARQEFEAFRGNPDDPRFAAAPRVAET